MLSAKVHAVCGGSERPEREAAEEPSGCFLLSWSWFLPGCRGLIGGAAPDFVERGRTIGGGDRKCRSLAQVPV